MGRGVSLDTAIRMADNATFGYQGDQRRRDASRYNDVDPIAFSAMQLPFRGALEAGFLAGIPAEIPYLLKWSAPAGPNYIL